MVPHGNQQLPSKHEEAAEGGSGQKSIVTEKLMEAEEKKLEEWKEKLRVWKQGRSCGEAANCSYYS